MKNVLKIIKGFKMTKNERRINIMKKIILIGLVTTTLFGGDNFFNGVIKKVENCDISRKKSILKFSNTNLSSSVAICRNKDGFIEVTQRVSVIEASKKSRCKLSFNNDYSVVKEICGDKTNVWVNGVKK